MPLLSTETKSNISFKKLVGKVHTGNATDFFQEAIPSQVSIDSSEVIGEDIPTDPAQATSDGLAEFVKADLQQISASNGLAFNLRFPATYNGFFGPQAAGDLIRSKTQIVDQKNNLDDGRAKSDDSGGYVYDLEDGNGNDVPLGAEEGWQIDPVAGVLSSEEVISELDNLGGTVGLYVYTGDFLSTIVNDLQGGNLAAPGNDTEVTFNDGGQIGTDTSFTFDGTTLTVPQLTLTNSPTTSSSSAFTVREDLGGEIRRVNDGGGANARYEGLSAFTFGVRNGSVGGFSVVFNENNIASGSASFAINSNNEAAGQNGFVGGELSEVTSDRTSAWGNNLLGRVYSGSVRGHYNEDDVGSGNEVSTLNNLTAANKTFAVGVGDDPNASSGNDSFIDGRGRVDGLYVTVRNGTYVRHGLQLDSYNSGTSSYERVLRFGSSIDETTNGEDIQLLARDPTANNVVEYITADTLINQEVNVIGGKNINTSFDAGNDEYTISTVNNPEFSGTILVSPSGTGYQVTVTDEGNLKTAATPASVGASAVTSPRLNYNGETLSVQADTGQTAPLYEGIDENSKEVFAVGPSGVVTTGVSINTARDAIARTYSLNQRTTDATQTVLQIDSQGLQKLPTFKDNSTWQFEGKVAARVESSSDPPSKGDTHVWKFKGVAEVTSGSIRTVGQPAISTVATDSSVSGYSLSININTNQELELQITGGTNDTVNWTARLETIELVA